MILGAWELKISKKLQEKLTESKQMCLERSWINGGASLGSNLIVRTCNPPRFLVKGCIDFRPNAAGVLHYAIQSSEDSQRVYV